MEYPITQGYGQDPNYPLNGGFHKGIDYGYPEGTPVIVNGVQIGLSGHTGYVTGPHLHVGKWVNGTVTDPGVGNGFIFDNATVFDTGYDSTNGNFVRISADGALWVYLHLSQINVSKGQSLKGEIMSEELVKLLFWEIFDQDPDADQLAFFTGKSSDEVLKNLFQSDKFKNHRTDVRNAFDAQNRLAAAIADASAKQAQIDQLNAKLAVQSEDTQLLNGFGLWLTKLIARLGLKK